MKIFDKAQWHIDANEDKEKVIKKFTILFEFLDKKAFLNQNGKELLDLGIDSSISLNETLVTKQGYEFLNTYYDHLINYSSGLLQQALEEFYKQMNLKN